MRDPLHSQGTLLFRPLDLSEMSVSSSLTNITVSATINIMGSIFALVCISIIFYEIFKYTDGVQRGRRAVVAAPPHPKAIGMDPSAS